MKYFLKTVVPSLIILAAMTSVSPAAGPGAGSDRIIFPDNILRDYNISATGTAFLPGSHDQILIVGYEAKDLFSKTVPLSYLAIYKVTTAGADLAYRFAPVVPGSVGYPNPLLLEKAQPAQMTASLAKINQQFKLVTSWGETGADYFGTHPIVIDYDKGKFRAVNFYKGNLSQDPKIKSVMWTRPDFTVTNYFEPKEAVKTILTQGVSLTDDRQIELQFYGDDQPHAADHQYVKILLPAFN